MVAATDAQVSDAEVVAELRAARADVSRAYGRCWAAMVEVDRRSPEEWGGEEIAALITCGRSRVSRPR